MLKKITILLYLLIHISVFSQNIKKEIYESENYSIEVPDTWKSTNDDGIVNLYPTNEIGAITISEYHDFKLPKTDIKNFILSLTHSQEEEDKVKSSSSKKGYTQYFYENFDEHQNLYWVTKVFHKNNNLYIISINCEKKYWNGNYMKMFIESFDSFKIKK